MSRDADSTAETPAETPVAPEWRARLLAMPPGRTGSGDDGPKRLSRHERVTEEECHQRGR